MKGAAKLVLLWIVTIGTIYFAATDKSKDPSLSQAPSAARAYARAYARTDVRAERTSNINRRIARYIPRYIPWYATRDRTAPTQFAPLINQSAQRRGLEPALIFAVIRVESGFNPRARSYKGAQGLMQLMPATARRYGVRNVFDPAQNIEGGSSYLAFLKARYNGDEELALAGYNWGEANVDKLLVSSSFRRTTFAGIRHRLPYETRSYVPLVMRYRKQYSAINF